MTARSLPALALAAALAAALAGRAAAQSAWAALGSGAEGSGVHALALDGGRLYVGGNLSRAGGQPSNLVAVWDGVGWTSLGPPNDGGGGTVHALAQAPDGRLYAGGGFFRMSGEVVWSLAEWDGAVWSRVGGGVRRWDGQTSQTTTVYALEVSGNGRLYVGGEFNWAGTTTTGVAAGAVAAWDGSSWRPVGETGLGGDVPSGWPAVRALAFGPDGRLYAGGAFSTADGEPVANVAAFDPANPDAGWDDLAGGLPSEFGIYTLAFGPDGRLYAGGDINGLVGGVDTDLAAWDGTAWRAVGPPVQGGFFALAFAPDGKLYAGGNATFSGGRYDVARLDGYLAGPGAGVWVPLGGGVTSSSGGDIVHALAVGSQGEVYVGGFFDRVWQAPGGASVAASNVAVWLGDRVVSADEPAAAGALAVRPNPARGASTVSVTLGSSSAVRVVVSDVLGRTVAVVHDGDLAAGTHGLAVDVSRWPAGVYAVRVVAGEASSSAHLTVVR